MNVLYLLLTGSFTFLTVSLFGIEVVLFGSLGILPTYASISTDYPAATGFYLIAVMNGSSCIGRILPGKPHHCCHHLLHSFAWLTS